MLKRALSIMLLFPLFGAGNGKQYTVPQWGQNPHASGCTPPGMTYRWVASSLTGTTNCGTSGTTLCANGGPVYTWPESVASNNATQTNSTKQPTFATNKINGYPAVSFNGSSGYMTFGTGIPYTNTTYTFYAVFSTASFPVSGQYILSGGGTSGALAYAIRPTAALGINLYGTGNVASGSTINSANTWYTKAVTFNSSTKAYAFYDCAGGTCTQSNSGTASSSQTAGTVNSISTPVAYVTGYLAEVGYYNGLSVSGIGAWSQCRYGL